MEVRRMNMKIRSSYGGDTVVVSKSKSNFSVETVLVLVGLAASLLILPVILPPLPPPPMMLLLVPIVILGGLMVFAFLPSCSLISGCQKGVI
ncbi:hypothetical protein HanXRQr2_Chr11g0504981 [Helianthus annuus]|uniref:Transmembrane protein n=1 Tax=Helianthus annuus TaxID=4232 RepID=A0A9K3HRL6_HELAN|nr:hypothetical protein HanXRQr2_Chr11g0504981 [Helianthus annuus]